MAEEGGYGEDATAGWSRWEREMGLMDYGSGYCTGLARSSG